MAKVKAVSPDELKAALHSWWTLDDVIMRVTEEQCLWLLKTERKGEARSRWVTRIYHRYSRLRRDREHREMGIVA